MSRIDKAKMPCNKPRRSPKKDKKKVVKACSGGREKIIHYGHSSYTTIRLPLEKALGLGTSAVRQKTS